MVTHTVRLWLDLDAEALSANDRLHWAAKSRRTHALRVKGHTAALAAHLPAMDRAHVEVTVHWPDGRRRDVDNLRPTIKALIDGMVDAGVLIDDDDRHLIGPDLRVADDRSGRPRAAMLDIAWTETAP